MLMRGVSFPPTMLIPSSTYGFARWTSMAVISPSGREGSFTQPRGDTSDIIKKKASLKKVISTSFQPLVQSWLDVIIHFLYKTTARKEVRYFIIQGPFEKILSERNRWCHTLLSRQRRGFRAVPARGGGANGAQEMDTGITEGPLHPGDHTLQPYYTYRQKDTKRWMTAILLTLLTIQGR